METKAAFFERIRNGLKQAAYNARVERWFEPVAIASDRERAPRSGPTGRTRSLLDRIYGQIGVFLARVIDQANTALHGHLPAALVLFLGVGISGAGFITTRNYYEDSARQEFERPAAQHTTVVSQAIDRYLEVVSSMGAFMSAAKNIDRWEFFALSEKSLPRFPGLHALKWVPRVSFEQRKAYEKKAEADGLYGFRINERDALGNRLPAGKREEYFPIYFVEPFEGNQAVLGFDLGAHPEGRKMLRLARDSGQMIATRQVEIAAGTASQTAFLTVLPIYGEAEPETVADRRTALKGFVLGVVGIGNMIEATLRDLASPDALDIYIYDVAAEGEDRLIYYHPSALRRKRPSPMPEAQVLSGLHRITDYDVAGRQWTIVIKPVPGYFGDAFNAMPWGVTALGLLLTLLLLQYLISSTNRTRIVERSVAERTAELVQANEALEREFTERARAEQERVGLERELAQIQKMESLGVLAGGIAHEINTPVQYVGENLAFLSESFNELGQTLARFQTVVDAAGAGGLLEHEVTQAKLASEEVDVDYLRREIPASIVQSLEGVERISEIVRAIREFSHPDAKEKTAVDINHTIATTLTVARNQLKHVAEVVTNFDPTLPQVPIFAGELNQVFLNLFVNAAHAIEEAAKGGLGKITVSTRAVDDEVEIRIADTGTGIPDELREKIFDPFFTTKEPGKGTGQGLAISHSIIQKKHGGSIAVESKVGEGTTFVIRLPITESGSSQAAA